MRYELTDSERSLINPMLPNKPHGVPRVGDRRILDGVFWVLRRDMTNSLPIIALFIKLASIWLWLRIYEVRTLVRLRSEFAVVEAKIDSACEDHIHVPTVSRQR
jgi:hypothetical protein